MTMRLWRVEGWHFLALILTVALSLCGLVGLNLLDAKRSDWDRASQSARNLAHAVAQEIGRTVETLDLSLRGVVESSKVSSVMELEPRLRDLVLFDRAATAPNLGYLMLLDANGRVKATARSSTDAAETFSDRPYFAAHQESPDLGLHISSPFRSRVTGEWVVALSRRISTADGVFEGVAVSTIRLGAIRELFAVMDLGPSGSITLFHLDGTLAMRVPYRAAFIGSDISGTAVYRQAMEAPNGSFVATSALDGITRLHTLATVSQSPLRIAVSIAVSDIEAGWWWHAFIVGLTAFALVIVLVWSALALRRELRLRHEAEKSARDSEANFRLLAENSGDMVSRIGPDGVRRYVSPASVRLLGQQPAELVGRRPEEEIHPNDKAGLSEALERLRLTQGDEVTASYRTRRIDGSWIWIESTIRVVRDALTGERDGVVAVSRDVTERKKVELELERLATLDGLTGLTNRRTFDDALSRAWHHAAQAELPLSTLLIDVDHFKALNDTLGHPQGDECLRQIGAVLKSMVRRAGDVAARYGGEEFVILLPETDADGAAAVAARVRAEIGALALRHPASGVAGGCVTVSVGGATLWPVLGMHAYGPGQLLELADEGLYEAKRRGRDRAVQKSIPVTAPVPDTVSRH